MSLPVPYFAIKVEFPSGASFWFTDQNDNFTLTLKQENAKVFLTRASGERYLAKLEAKNPASFEKFKFTVVQMGLQ